MPLGLTEILLIQNKDIPSMNHAFSLYLSDLAVELQNEQDAYLGKGRFICSQKNYDSLLKFAKRLSYARQVPLKNYTQTQAGSLC
jgi:hypothetical protein